MRVTQDHWSVLVEYAELHPEVITNQQIGSRGRESLEEKWEDLSTILNGLGHGSKTVSEWKKSLADWKSNTKKKYSTIRSSQTGTGGGPKIELSLTDIEMRLLQIMGQTALDGDCGIEEYGLAKKVVTRQKLEVHTQKDRSIDEFGRGHEKNKENPSMTTEDVQNSPPPIRSRKRKADISARIEEMNDDTLRVLHRMDMNLASIAGDFKRIVSFFVDDSNGTKQ